MRASGHQVEPLTLHVGAGTFLPVQSEDLRDHVMHEERYEIPATTVRAIQLAKREGRAVVAIGTTALRTLESVPELLLHEKSYSGRTAIFIRPGFRFQVADALMTNFHLPESTLLALVMAFLGQDATRAAYATAIAERYRFFSYGDAMLILPAG